MGLPELLLTPCLQTESSLPLVPPRSSVGLQPTVDFVSQQTHCPTCSPSNCIPGTPQNTLVSCTSKFNLMDKDEHVKRVNEELSTFHKALTLSLQEAESQKKVKWQPKVLDSHSPLSCEPRKGGSRKQREVSIRCCSSRVGH